MLTNHTGLTKKEFEKKNLRSPDITYAHPLCYSSPSALRGVVKYAEFLARVFKDPKREIGI